MAGRDEEMVLIVLSAADVVEEYRSSVFPCTSAGKNARDASVKWVGHEEITCMQVYGSKC